LNAQENHADRARGAGAHKITTCAGCTRGIYDNMKTAVDSVFIGKDRQYNRRFLRMCSHFLVDPVACTPASGWEKGQVENQSREMSAREVMERVAERGTQPGALNSGGMNLFKLSVDIGASGAAHVLH
jgi:transposase